MAERLGRALQKLLQRFKSASDLTKSLFCAAERGFLFLKRLNRRFSKRKKQKDLKPEGFEKGFGAMGDPRDSA